MNLNNENYKKQIIPVLIYLFISFFLVSLSVVKFFEPIYFINDKLTQNTRSGLYNFGLTINQYTAFFSNSQNIIKENESLKRKLYDFQSLASKNTQLENENTALRDQLGSPVSQKKHSVLSLITYRSSILDYINIDKGSDDGIVKNNIVVYKNILVGIVSDVTPSSAKIQLITDKDSAIPAQISGSNVNGIVGGSLQLGLVMNEILPDDPVPINANVVTSGLNGGIYPDGLLIGTIKSVQPVSSNPFKTAVITPSLDITQFNYVFVLKN